MPHKPVVAYTNGRLILVRTYEGVREYRSTSEFDGHAFKHTCIVWQEGEAWWLLTDSEHAATGQKRRVETMAFVTERDALHGGVVSVANARGWHL